MCIYFSFSHSITTAYVRVKFSSKLPLLHHVQLWRYTIQLHILTVVKRAVRVYSGTDLGHYERGGADYVHDYHGDGLFDSVDLCSGDEGAPPVVCRSLGATRPQAGLGALPYFAAYAGISVHQHQQGYYEDGNAEPVTDDRSETLWRMWELIVSCLLFLAVPT